MVLFAFLIFVLLFLSYFYTIRKFLYWQKRGIPYDKPFPYIGNTLALFTRSMGVYIKILYDKFDSPLVGMFLFGQPQLVVKDPRMIKAILIEDFSNFSDRTIISNVKADPLASKVLAIIKNPQWKEIRQKMTVAFTIGKLKLMFPLMLEVGDDLVNYIERKRDGTFHGKDLSTRFTTDTIVSCAFGVKAFSFVHEDSEFRYISKKTFELTFSRGIQMVCYFVSPFMVSLFKMKFLEPHCSNLMKKLFWRIVKERRRTRIVRNDLVDILIELQEAEDDNGNLKFDGDVLAAQAIQFFTAGFETSASTICFAMFELARHLDIQHKLRNDILTVVEETNGLNYEAVLAMKYLDMVVHETLRKYPIIPFLDRRTKSDYRIPGTDFTIEKGVPVFIPVLGLHYDPKYYPEPERFDPERFNAENKVARPSYVYLAFGDGPRNCIGVRFALLTVKLFLIKILMEYEIHSADDMCTNVKIYPRGFLHTPAVPVKIILKRIQASC